MNTQNGNKMKNLPKVAVFGGGSWATALVKMLCENLDEVGWYMRNEASIEYIKENEHNPNYLTSAEFDVSKLKLSSDINEMASYADYLIMVIPSAFVKTALACCGSKYCDECAAVAASG